LLDSQPDSNDESETWNLEYQRRLASLAMERIRHEFKENTWRAFWLTAVEGQAAIDAAPQVGMSAGAIYVAKSRVLARLRQEVEMMRLQEEER
jgi:RNA polymerase sigma-70 factor (ECF subfamily)